MTDPRTLVKQTLTFSSPKRIPRDVWFLPWAGIHYPEELTEIRERFPNDLVGAPGFQRALPPTSGDPYGIGTYIDEWGCAFEGVQPGVIGEVKAPLVARWEDLDKVRPPEELLSIDVEQINDFCRSTDLFVTAGCCPRPFERMQFLRGSENLYFDLAEEMQGNQQSDFSTLLNRVHQFYLKELEQWVKTDVDGLTFMDDWGAQRSLLISPRQWRRIFKPLYKDYIDLAHQHGKFIFMHSDGYTLDIIPDLIELGLDALNTQLFTMDIARLGERFRGKLTFWGEIDRQHLLPFGTRAEIDRAVRQVQEAFYCHGGVIAQCEFSAGAKPENVYQVFQSWEEVLHEQ
jgi:uroporphyrinogen decarboxylase